MATEFPCSSCGRNVGYAASKCPHCGSPVTSSDIAVRRASSERAASRKVMFALTPLVLIGFLFVIFSNADQGADSIARAPHEADGKVTKGGPLAPIDPGVYEPYKREQGWEKTFARWGDKGVARIQHLREAAAQTVARNPKCDAVELSEISDSRSTPPDSPTVYVDCANGERFYLSESEVGGTVSTEMEKGARFSSADLIRHCTDAVRARLNLPASFDQNMWSVSDRQGTSGNRVVEFDFEAKNYFGATLPAQARCIMTTRGQFEVTVIE